MKHRPILVSAVLILALVAGVASWWAGQGGTARPEGAINVPSGLAVTLIDVITNEPGPAGLTTRFRFLSPDLGSITPEAAQADMQALCDGYALARIPTTGPQPAQIVISLSDRVVPFGEAQPEATQVFGAFSPTDATCIWELF